MGKKLKKKASQKKKMFERNYDSGRVDWGLCGSNSSDLESPQNEDEQTKELSGMNLLSSGDTFLFPFDDDESDNETIEFALMGERERYQIEVEFRDKIRDQQDLLDNRECASKEEATKLKAQLEEGNKEKEDQCQKLQDEVTSLKNEVNKRSTTIKKLKDRSTYYESLEAKILSLKEDLEKSNKQNKELLQALEEQENKVLELRQQMEEGRKVEEIMKKHYLEKVE